MSQASLQGFYPGGGVGFTYDNNGNLKTDSYKGITNITYNHLNLPSLIQWGSTKSIIFVYDAMGSKLSKTVMTSTTNNYTQDYIGGIEYNSPSGINRKIEAIYHSEGRYYNTSATATPAFRNEFTIKDHLGNARISFTDKDGNGKIDVNNLSTNEILQENHYYAFGMAFEGTWLINDAAKDNSYMYNGKEMNADHGLKWSDYGARWYDATIGRWSTVDPMINQTKGWSGYNYVENNPLVKSDPSGKYSESMHNQDLATGAAVRISGGDIELTKDKNGAWVQKSSSGDPIDKVTDKNKKNISVSSWGETSGLYPTKTMNPSEKEKFNPALWDEELTEELLKARAAVNLVSSRNKDHKESKPNLKSAIEKMLAAYHLTDNFPDVDSEVKDDNSVKYFYLSPDAEAKTPSIDSRYWDQEKVKSYGPFYNIGGGDVPKGPTYIHFYKPVKKPTK